MVNAQVKPVDVQQYREVGAGAPHRIFSLLLGSAIERADQAGHAAAEQRWQDLAVLMQRCVALISGLRSSLDMEAGSTASRQLAEAYDAMLERIHQSEPRMLKAAFADVSRSLLMLKAEWDGRVATGSGGH